MQLNHVITDKHKAAFAQWLSSADEAEIVHLRNIISIAFGKARGEEAQREMNRALSRSIVISQQSMASSKHFSRAGSTLAGGSDDGDDAPNTWPSMKALGSAMQSTGGASEPLSPALAGAKSGGK